MFLSLSLYICIIFQIIYLSIYLSIYQSNYLSKPPTTPTHPHYTHPKTPTFKNSVRSSNNINNNNNDKNRPYSRLTPSRPLPGIKTHLCLSLMRWIINELTGGKDYICMRIALYVLGWELNGVCRGRN